MSKQLEKIQALHCNTFFEELSAARERADSADTTGTTLGEGQTIQLLAATQAESIEALINSASVIKRTKRSALIQVGNLLYAANKWGVVICLVPAQHVIGSFNAVWGPSLPYSVRDSIFSRLGVVSSWAGKDCLKDYSQCVESQPSWMAA